MKPLYIYENHIAENMDTDHSYMYIDVGGGSTELTFFSDGKLLYKHSFNIGTIRLLKEPGGRQHLERNERCYQDHNKRTEKSWLR